MIDNLIDYSGQNERPFWPKPILGGRKNDSTTFFMPL
jgi:hypothetical protein